MLRIGVVIMLALLAGCFDDGCRVTGPGGATSTFYYDAIASESDLRGVLAAEGWEDVRRNTIAPGIFLEGSRRHGDQDLKVVASSSESSRIVGFSVYADEANVTSDEEARALLEPLVGGLTAGAPSAWRDAKSVRYSGGAKVCV